MIKLGSLFDGISGFPYIAQRLGIKPVWASEIGRAAIAISKKHFPKMEHLGDITKIDGSQIEPVHVVTFGSPCQDLSVAGRGKGLDGERSGLFREAVRIIREMRVATDRVYPRFALWENVPGAFSSNAGQDFRAVLSELAEAEVPMPQSGKWATAGVVELRDRRIFWRVLDAQYWGVPQRRKRIFLVVDFGNGCGPEILFKPESMRGDSEKGGTAREEVARNAGEGIEKPVIPLNTQIITRHNKLGRNTGFGAGKIGDPAYTLQEAHHHGVCLGFQSNASISDGQPVLEEKVPTIRTTSDSAVAIDCRNHSIGNVSGTLQAKSNGGQSLNYINPIMLTDVASTLRAGSGAPKHESDERGRLVHCPKVTGTLCASGAGTNRPAEQGNEVDLVIALQGNGIDRADTAGCNGLGAKENISYTLNTVDRHGVAFHSFKSFGDYRQSDTAKTLMACDDITTGDLVCQEYIVRRLTPTECERLQDFPDGWTEWGEVYLPAVNSKKLERDLAKGMLRLGVTKDQLLERISDSARYQTLGNSIAIPCGEYALEGIATALREVAG